MNSKISIFIIIIFISFIFVVDLAFSNYIILKENLDEILLTKRNSKIYVLEKTNIKCYFNKICVTKEPIPGFEKYFFRDRPIFRILRKESLSLIDVYRVWNSSFENLNLTGTNVRIAILDTGIDISHKDLNYNLENWSCYYSIFPRELEDNSWKSCMDDNGHGTHIAGIIAARYDGNYSKCFENYPCGIAFNSTILIGKVLDKEGKGRFIDVLNGISWAISKGADIISMSLGIDLSLFNITTCYPSGNSDIEKIIKAFNELIDSISLNHSVVIVAAAGNNPNSISAPACAKNVIAVGSINKDRKVSYFSSRGPIDNRIKPDLVAPGTEINSTFIYNSYSLKSGTSMSVPFVAGSIALLLEALRKENITTSSQEVKSIVLTSPNELERNNNFGSGILNVTEMIRIRKNFMSIENKDKETFTFLVNKSDNYPFKLTIYRHEKSFNNNSITLVIIKNNTIIYNFSSSDNVIQYKNSSLNGLFFILVNISRESKITFASSHKILNLNEFLTKNFKFENSIIPFIDIHVEEPIKFYSNKIKFKITTRDFYGNPITVDNINISLFDNSYNLLFFNSFLNINESSFEIEVNFTGNLSSTNYTVLIIVEKGKIYGVKSINFTFLPIYFFYPGKILKLMNGDLLNITFATIFENISLIRSYIFHENDKNINFTLNFRNISNIYYNYSIINLSIPGTYILFLEFNFLTYNIVQETPIFLFSPVYNFLLEYRDKMFADREYILNISIFHINGSRSLSAQNITKKICLLNYSAFIFCNSTVSDQIRIVTNITLKGEHNISLEAYDIWRNHLKSNFSVVIEFYPDLILVDRNKDRFTILEPLRINFSVINSSRRTECNFCKVYINVTKIEENKTIFSNLSAEEIIDKPISKDWKRGKYEVFFFSFLNPLIVNSTTIEIDTLNISTNVSGKVFPNFINITINISIEKISNITINISKINISGIYQLIPEIDFKISSGCNKRKIENNILLCNLTNNTIILINTSEVSTYLLEIYAFGDNKNGYLLDRFYSGFLIRPKDINRKSCKDVLQEDIFINRHIRNHCIFDSKKQKDLAINPNESIDFIALAYAGATLEKNIPIFISAEVKYNNTTKTFFSYNYSSNGLIHLQMQNFSNLGVYIINLTYNYTDSNLFAIKTEIFEINVYTLEFHPLIIKNYIKKGDNLMISGSINRTNSSFSFVPENITSLKILLEGTQFNYSYNPIGKIEVNISIPPIFFGNLIFYIEDELGIEKNFNISNITVLDLNLELSSPEIVFLGQHFIIRATAHLIPLKINLPVTFSSEINGNCELVLSSNFTNTLRLILNPKQVGICEVVISANTSYLDMFFSSSNRTLIIIVSPSKSGDNYFASVPTSLLIRKISDSLIIKKGSSNHTFIFVKSIGRDQNVFAYLLDYPENLIQIIPKNQTIKKEEEVSFLLNISLSLNETRREFNITIIFNSTYVLNQTKIHIIALESEVEDKKEEYQAENDFFEKEIYLLEKELTRLEENIIRRKEREALLEELFRARKLLNEAKLYLIQSQNISKSSEIKEKLEEIRRIVNLVNSKLDIKENIDTKSAFGGEKLFIIGLILFSLIIFIVFFYFLSIRKKRTAYFDPEKKRFVWSKEDEVIWEKLKRKWGKKQQ